MGHDELSWLGSGFYLWDTTWFQRWLASRMHFKEFLWACIQTVPNWTPKLAVMILFVLSLCSLWSRYWHGLVFVGSSLSKCPEELSFLECSTCIIHSLSKPGRTSPLCLRVTYCNPENHESWHTQAFWGQGLLQKNIPMGSQWSSVIKCNELGSVINIDYRYISLW